MATTNEQVIETLNGLLAVCKASERGFRAAAEASSQAEARTLLKHYAGQRHRVASELRMEIRLLGGEPETLDGMALPVWPDGGFEPLGSVDPLTACLPMEEIVEQRFQAALDDANLPVELLIALRRLFMQVREAKDRLRVTKQAERAPLIDAELHPA